MKQLFIDIRNRILAISDGEYSYASAYIPNGESALNDFSYFGTYTGGSINDVFTIIITPGSPDVFEWSSNNGSGTGRIVTGANQYLIDGISIKFAATTGHSSGDLWKVTMTSKPKFHFVQMWNNQLEDNESGKGYSFQMPAAFIEFISPTEIKQLGNGAQLYDPLIVRIHLVHEFYNATDGNGTMEQDLPVFDIRNLIQDALQKFEPDNAVAFVRSGESQDNDHDNVYHMMIDYMTNYIDARREEPIGSIIKDPPTELVVTIEFPGSSELAASTTLESVNRRFWLGGMENAYFVSGNDLTYHDIRSDPFKSNVASLGLEGIDDWGIPPNHYGRRFVGDRPDQPPPSDYPGRGLFNTLVTCNEGSGYANTYLISAWAYAVKFAQELNLKMLMNCNINDFNIPAYIDNMGYTDDIVGLIGLNVAGEYWSDGWCSSNLNNKPAGVRDAVSALIAGVIGAFPDQRYINDWRGIRPGQPITDNYSNIVKNAVGYTSTRFYLDDMSLIPHAELVAGRSGGQYRVSIDTAFDDVLPGLLKGIKAITGKPVSITQLFTEAANSGYGHTFGQAYFLARAYVKLIELEAANPGLIELVIMPRFDMINAKGHNMNFLGKTMLLLKPLFTAGNVVHTINLPTGMSGIGSLDNTGHGSLCIINPTDIDLNNRSIRIGNATRSFLSIQALTATDFLDSSPVYQPTDVVKNNAISIVTI